MISVFSYAKEAFHHAKRTVLTFVGWLAAIWGVLSFFLDAKTGLYIFLIMASVCVVVAMWTFLKLFVSIKGGRVTVTMFGKRTTTLLRNDFQENMDYLLHSLTHEELKRFAFIMGIDITGRLDISSESGVAHWVLKYLDENYLCEQVSPMDYIQQELNKELKSHPSGSLSYGDCVEIRCKLQQKTRTDSDTMIPCNLILIANSRKEVPNNKKLEEKMLDDNMSNIIVPKVFDYLLMTSWYTGCMMGVLGTNGMRQSYQVIFSQIINQFARVCYKDMRSPMLHLYISVRESDYNRSNMSLSNLEKYVRQCAGYYTTWIQESEV